MCLVLVWRVCDQAFGRYRPMKGAEKLKICIYTHVDRFSDSKNAILFDLQRKITVSEQWRHQALGRLELIVIVITFLITAVDDQILHHGIG